MRDLYQQVIIDHGRRPRNCRRIEDADHMMVGNNPLCGDKLVVYVKMDGDMISDVSFEGDGCAISMASASLMTEALKGMRIDQSKKCFEAFHAMLTIDDAPIVEGKLSVLEGVKAYPMRIKCATLAWHAMDAALHVNNDEVSTE